MTLIAPSLKILHLVAPDPPVTTPWFVAEGRAWEGGVTGTLLCREAILGYPAHEHRVLVSGGPASARICRRLGLRVDGTLAMPLGIPRLGEVGFAGAIRRWGRPDVIQAWGGAWDSLKGRSRWRHGAWCGVDLASGTVRTDSGEWATLEAGPIDASACLSRDKARERLGIGDSLTVALLGEAPGEADAVSAALVGGILGVAGKRACVLVSSRASGVNRALRHAEDGPYIDRLITLKAPMCRYLPGADVCLWSPPRRTPVFGSSVHVGLAQALGLRVVAEPREDLRRASAGLMPIEWSGAEGPASLCSAILSPPRAERPGSATGAMMSSLAEAWSSLAVAK